MFENAIILNSQLAVSILPSTRPPLMVTPMLTADTFAESDDIDTHIDTYPEEGIIVLTFCHQTDQPLSFVLDASASSTRDLLQVAAETNSIMLGSTLPPGDIGMTIFAGITDVCGRALANLQMPSAHAERHVPATFVSRALALGFLLGHSASVRDTDDHGEQAFPIRLNVVLGPEHLGDEDAPPASSTLH